mgnify:FL=1
MELTKLTTVYSVKESSELLTFSGEALLNSSDEIQSLNGVVTTTEETPLSANVYYSFNNGTNNQNISNLDERYRVEVATLLDTIIKNIKIQIVG